MKHINFWAIFVLMLATFLLAACGPKPVPVTGAKPAEIVEIEGSELKQVHLTQKAAERIDIQTAPVGATDVNGVKRQVVPYAAVIYDTAGNTWVYTNPEALIFVREPIKVAFIEGDQAVLLSDNLSSETLIVTVGVAELYGAETGVSK